MTTRIGMQVIVGVGVVTALSIGLMAVLIIGTHERQLIAERTHEAEQFSETIKSSTYHDMLENRRAALHRQIQTIGRQEGIDRVRVFNKEGMIMFSSDSGEIGRSLNKQAEACYACHAEGRPLERLPETARTRVFRGPDGTRVLGTINPIHNEATCYEAACHAHTASQAVLGVLDVTVSLEQVDRQIAASRARMGGLALITILASSAILWWLNRRLVIKPVQALVSGTRRVAEGDLSTKIPEMGRHELGDLARAFNSMTGELAEAQRQVTRAEKLASVGRLAAGVAHEINNPLTGVLTYSSFLLKRAEGQPELEEDLQVIVRETKRCREIVKGLLDFSRRTPPKIQPIDLSETVRRAVAVVMNQLRLDQVALTLDLASDLPAVPADDNQIQQVLVNLLLNAADAIGPEGGKIRVEARPTLLSPKGHLPIRRAACPRGCDLLDEQVRIQSLPTIRVIRRFDDGESVIHLDPVYGRFHHINSDPHEERDPTSYLCPRCRTSLNVAGGSCAECGTFTFAVEVEGEGRVEWCGRCHWSHWSSREALGPTPFAQIVVEDSGCGITPEALTHVFEPFFSTKGPRGTGLGLAVTWGIVESHGGSISVESEVGRGSRFTVRLPVAAAGAAAASTAASTAA